MRFERLTLVQGRHALTLGFHPCLTVIAGVGPEEREGLTGELLGALAGTRRGATLELVDDTGQQFAIHRGEMASDDKVCLLYTSPSPRDLSTSRMPSSA